ncbi:winged helix-turn-helix domain-containing protein [Streptomyces sp. NPDC087305]|uniref:winged helix-turn-helix domain-containing protein n=1 Tax=Streptomyces sp. NPDC087305 TaxID=3365781 RepID=UPI0038126710
MAALSGGERRRVLEERLREHTTATTENFVWRREQARERQTHRDAARKGLAEEAGKFAATWSANLTDATDVAAGIGHVRTVVTAVITTAQGEFMAMLDPGEPDADPVGAASVLAFTALRAVDAVLPGGSSSALERLSRTRAAVLVQVTCGRTRTTSEVARAVGIALPGVGYQLAVLRDGGLVASYREGELGRHSVTPMGHRLLGADPRRRTDTGPACGPGVLPSALGCGCRPAQQLRIE